MKAICIRNRDMETPEEMVKYRLLENDRNAQLTIGKVYEVENTGFDPLGLKSRYRVTADTGHPINVPKYYFKMIDEYRQEQLDKILE